MQFDKFRILALDYVAKLFRRYRNIVSLVIVVLSFFIFHKQILQVWHQHQDSKLWNVISAVGTMLAAIFAAESALRARDAINISNKAFDNQIRPVFLFSNLKDGGLHINEDDTRYCIDLSFCNHGKGVALVREVQSIEKYLACYIRPPISIGTGDITDITLLFDKRRINEIIDKYINCEEDNYNDKEWNVEVRKTFIATFAPNEFNTVIMSRQIKLMIYYWSIAEKCYCNEIDLIITIKNKIHMYVECFVVSEKTVDVYNKGIIPSSVKQYDCI